MSRAEEPIVPRPEEAEPAGPDAAAATTGTSVVRGGLWNAASRALPQVYTLVTSIAAARFLGPDDMGRQSFIAFVSLSATMLLAGGLSDSLMRHIGEMLGRREPASVRGLVGWAWRIAAVGAAIGGAALAAVGLAGADPQAAWLLAAVGCSLGVMHTVPTAVLIGAQRWREASIVGMVTGPVAVGATIAVLAAGGGITGMFAVQAAVAAVNLAWISLLGRRFAVALTPRSALARDLRHRSASFAAWSSIGVVLTLIVFRRSEFFFLERFSTDAEIAIYSIAFAVVYALTLVPQALAAAIIPAFATLFGAGATERVRSGYGRALRLLSLLTLPILAGVLALGPEGLRVVYGDDYAGTGPVLTVMMLTFPLLPLVGVSGSLLVGLGRVRPQLVIGGVAALVNVALALALIPPYGAVGAGLANAGAQGGIAVASLAYSWRLVGRPRLDFGALVGIASASAAGGLAAWMVLSIIGGPTGLAVGAIIGVAAFGLVAVILRIIPAEDVGWLRTVAGDRLGGRVDWACRLLGRPQPRVEQA